MASLAFAFPLRAGKTEEWRAWVREILGPRRSEYEAFSRQLGLKTQRAYLQHTPQGDQAIIYLEGEDLQRTFQQLRTAQDPFTILVRQQTMDLFGVDLTQIHGISETAALALIGEIGIDMSPWKTEKHFASWLALCPNNKISGGKTLRR